MEDLESKIGDELATLKSQLAAIDSDAEKFADVDALRRETEAKRNRLMADHDDLTEKRNEIQAQVNRLQKTHDSIQVSIQISIFR